MSETNQGGNKNRNNQNRNRQGGNRNNNRGNNRNRNNNGGNRNNTRNRQGGNRNTQGGNKKPAPQPLTFWQKILAIFGIKPKTQTAAKPQNKSNSAPKKKTAPATKKARAPQKVEVTSGRLYVGNLSYETTEYDLEDLFKGNGPVKSVEIIYNRHTHKSKGYGFVEMRNVEDAKNAVDVHHEQPFMGRNLIVNGAKNRQPDDNKKSDSSDDAA